MSKSFQIKIFVLRTGLITNLQYFNFFCARAKSRQKVQSSHITMRISKRQGIVLLSLSFLYNFSPIIVVSCSVSARLILFFTHARSLH